MTQAVDVKKLLSSLKLKKQGIFPNCYGEISFVPIVSQLIIISIIMYPLMYYFSRLAHIAHYKAKNPNSQNSHSTHISVHARAHTNRIACRGEISKMMRKTERV